MTYQKNVNMSKVKEMKKEKIKPKSREEEHNGKMHYPCAKD